MSRRRECERPQTGLQDAALLAEDGSNCWRAVQNGHDRINRLELAAAELEEIVAGGYEIDPPMALRLFECGDAEAVKIAEAAFRIIMGEPSLRSA